MEYISLSQGKKAKIDANLKDKIASKKWHYNTKYARRTEKHRVVWLHRYVWELVNGAIPEGLVIDHINCDRLDNQISNLRLATRAQNSQNQGARKGKSFRGLHFYKGIWQVTVGENGNKHHIGSFVSLETAIKKYNEAAVKYHGEFAKLNELEKVI